MKLNKCLIKLNILVPFDADSVATEFSTMQLTLSFDVSLAYLEQPEAGFTFCTQVAPPFTKGKHSIVIPLPAACPCTCAEDDITLQWVGDVLEIRYSIFQKVTLTPSKKNKQ